MLTVNVKEIDRKEAKKNFFRENVQIWQIHHKKQKNCCSDDQNYYRRPIGIL